ncbi:MAG: O-antigen ligase family protein [Oscillospiraceae bacterium]|nr:O-antigen ligase family protein [Oscillospiraceae bacterium]
MKADLREKLISWLPLLTFCLFALQIPMDVLSFWMGRLGMSNLLTLALRLGVLAVVLLAGFLASGNKKIWWITAGVLGALFAGHLWAIFDYGVSSLMTDLTNFVRVVQMPLLTVCLICFMKENHKCYDAMKWGVATCLWLVFLVQILAILTGTEPHTYKDGSGYIGWFNNTNSQSNNLCMLAPVAIALTLKKWGMKHPAFWLTLAGSVTAMFFLSTRLAYLGLVITTLGLGISLIFINWRDWKRAIAFFLIAIVFVGLIPVSPMVTHQNQYESVQVDRQEGIDQSMKETQPPVEAETTEPPTQEELMAQKIEKLTWIYEFYIPDFVEIFGLERTMEMFNYTSDIYQLTMLRPKKLKFAQMLMDDSPFSARLFGLELSRFTVNNNIYDVENDLHGIYYLYGVAGLAAMLLFLAYFVWLILWALFKDIRKYFTWDAAAWGIAFLLSAPHIYCTAGVLRRPSAAIYLAAALAAVYYLVKLKVYEKETVTK